MKRIAVALAILMLALAFGCDKKETPKFSTGDKAPDFVLQDLNGQPVRLSDYKGKVVVLEFWATWCPPCVAAIPELNELQAKHIDQDFALFAVSVDDDIEVLKAFYEEHDITYPTLFDDKGVNNDFGIYSIPTSVVVGKDGKIFKRHVGYAPDVLKELVQEALSAEVSQ